MTESLLVTSTEQRYLTLETTVEDSLATQDVVGYIGEVTMTGCIIYPDCPTPNSCSDGCKYGSVAPDET